MSDPNFTSVLDQPLDEITRPPAPPTGTALLQVVGQPVRRDLETKDGPKEIIEISLKPISYTQTDDPSKSGYDLSGTRPLRKTLWFTKPQATHEELFAFQQIARSIFKIETKGKSPKQVCAEMMGKQCIGKIGNKPAQDQVTGDMFMEATLGALAPA